MLKSAKQLSKGSKKASPKKQATPKASPIVEATPIASPSVSIDDSKVAFYKGLREASLDLGDIGSRKVRDFNISQASKDAHSMFVIACEAIAQQRGEGDLNPFIKGGKLASIVQAITSIDPLAFKKAETPFKQGIHRISKGITRELKQSKSSPTEFLDTFAIGKLSDGKSPLYKCITPKGEGGREIGRDRDKLYYYEASLIGEYPRPSHDELVQACNWVSVESHKE